MISVILTSYNKSLMLDLAIRSVVHQSYQDWELLIMDDNSSNQAVVDVLKRWWHHDKIRIFKSKVAASDRMKTARYATLINQALDMVEGEYVTYLTDDDWYLTDRLKDMLEAIEACEGRVVYGQQTLYNADTSEYLGIRPGEGILDTGRDVVDHCSVMHDTKLAFEVGKWDDSPEHWRAADGIFWQRINDAGHKFYPVGKKTDVHTFHSGSVRHKLLELGMNDLS